MARVHLPQQLHHLTGDVREVVLDVPDYRALISALEARFAGCRALIDGRMAVVIDGDIIDTPLLERLAPDSEVHFLPRVGGG
ncbi:MAG TPA: MoaD/ThiS family protein [Pseudomonadales bacterium]|nr:MoaD/ThiS family protein [Pseudomonadales bacterium]